MTAAMPTAEMGKAMQESMAKATGGGAAPKAGQGKARSGKAAGNGE
jgi:hypothetical protein